MHAGAERNGAACMRGSMHARAERSGAVQELNLSANYLDAAMLPAYVTGTPHTQQYAAWNAPLQAAFRNLHALTALDLSCNCLTASNLQTLLAPAVPVGDAPPGSPFAHRLQSLDISSNALTPLAPLVPVLAQLTALTRLGLTDAALRWIDARELLPALTRMRAMCWLSIGSNRITHSAGPVLAAALACMPALERLDASGHIMFQLGPGAPLAASRSTPDPASVHRTCIAGMHAMRTHLALSAVKHTHACMPPNAPTACMPHMHAMHARVQVCARWRRRLRRPRGWSTWTCASRAWGSRALRRWRPPSRSCTH
jgi:hypothetical protein